MLVERLVWDVATYASDIGGQTGKNLAREESLQEQYLPLQLSVNWPSMVQDSRGRTVLVYLRDALTAERQVRPCTVPHTNLTCIDSLKLHPRWLLSIPAYESNGKRDEIAMTPSGEMLNNIFWPNMSAPRLGVATSRRHRAGKVKGNMYVL